MLSIVSIGTSGNGTHLTMTKTTIRQAATSANGFTLIELMIVVVVVAILAAVAYPAYQNQVRESRRSDAHIALSKLANDLEKFRSECGTYPTAAHPGNITGARSCVDGRLGRSNVSTNGNYALRLDTAGAGVPAGGYLLTATAQAQQANDRDCKTLTITSIGTTGATADAGGNTAKCWRR